MSPTTALVPTSPAMWPTPMEPIWHMLPGSSVSLPGCQRPDLGLAERLFIGAVVTHRVPRDRRPWRCVTWLANVFCVSRVSLYAIGERARAGFWAASPERTKPATLTAVPETEGPRVRLTRQRLLRTILTLLVPGGVPVGLVALCLQVALDLSRSVGFISELLQEAGRRAGRVLDGIDHRPLGPVTLARDEIFTGSAPNLLLVEPRSLTITRLYATPDCDADTWVCALWLTQDRRVDLQGLVEDDCRT